MVDSCSLMCMVLKNNCDQNKLGLFKMVSSLFLHGEHLYTLRSKSYC